MYSQQCQQHLEQGLVVHMHNCTSSYDLCASIHTYKQQYQQITALLQYATLEENWMTLTKRGQLRGCVRHDPV